MRVFAVHSTWIGNLRRGFVDSPTLRQRQPVSTRSIATARYRVVRITHEEDYSERHEDGGKVLLFPNRIKKELLGEGDGPCPDGPPLEFFVDLGVLVEEDDDTTHDGDVLDAIEGNEQPVYSYELELRAAERAGRWALSGVFGNVRSDAEPLEELECDNSPQEAIIIEGL